MKISSALLLAAVAFGATPLPDHVSIDSITVGDIRAELYFLASDEMQGRAVDSPANALVSRYIANRFEKMGLRPAGTNGYFQEFDIVRSVLAEPNRLSLKAGGHDIDTSLEEDFFPSPLTATASGRGAVVFAGYGITAPDLGYDDYRGLDVKGKVVLVLDHEPGENDPASLFDGLVDTDYGRDLHKILNAQKRGAVALIIAEDEANHSRSGDMARGARVTWPADPRESRFFLKAWVDEIQIPAVFVSAAKADQLLPPDRRLMDLQLSIDASLRPAGFLIPGSGAAVQTSVVRTKTSVRNVLASLPGSDPKLGKEWIVVGAHFDHVGIDGEDIFNGADDDGSGTVGLMATARAYTVGNVPPKRSVLFAAWNAEETGLLGSYYFVQQPTVPLDKAVAVFQMDMIGRNEEVSDPTSYRFRGLDIQTAAENANALNILGYSKSPDLEKLARQANHEVGLDLHFRYDNQVLGLLRRSDHWPFLNKGIPALFFHTGLHPDYHRPTDTPDKINYEKMAKVIRLVFLSSWEAANDPGKPRFQHERMAR